MSKEKAPAAATVRSPKRKSNYLTAEQIKEQIKGREIEILSSLKICWPAETPHIHCPFPDHRDKRPSWRWDDKKSCFFCTCGSGDILKVVQCVNRCGFREALRWITDTFLIYRTSAAVSSRPNNKGYSLPAASGDAPDFASAGFGIPSHVYDYRNHNGELVGCVARWDLPGGAKEIRPFSKRQDGHQNQEWVMKWLISPSPLYPLHKLRSPVRTVVLVEGEKCADVLNAMGFETMLAMTWQGGSQAIAKTDFSPLKGYDVVLWPDNDPPGFQAMQKAVALVAQAGGEIKGVVAPSEDKPVKWDVADAIEAGEDIGAILSTLKPVNYLLSADSKAEKNSDDQRIVTSIPSQFVLRPEGLYFRSEGSSATDEIEKVCSYFLVKAITRSADRDSNWGHFVEFHDTDGGVHSCSIPSALFTSSRTGEVVSLLRDRGLHLIPGRKAEQRLCEYIISSKPPLRMTSVDQVGWHGEIFVLPDATVGNGVSSSEQVILQSEYLAENPYRCNGGLEEWKEHIGKYCEGNELLTFAVSAAVAGPLLKPANRESGGFHFYGPSSIGKTTLLVAAGSVCGISSPAGFIETWRATSNGLEGLAALHNDNLLCLDEISQIDPQELGQAAYMLANGQAKRRARKSGFSHKPLNWRLIYLSSGEIPLATKILEDQGKRASAGQIVRIVDINAGMGEYGVFDHLHEMSTPADFANNIKTAAAGYYGTPLRVFLQHLVAVCSSVASRIERISESFKECCLKGADGQVIRVSDRFALVAAAGELAIEWGIFPIRPGSALAASRKSFEQWLEQRGSVASHESKASLEHVRNFLQTQMNRFGNANGRNDRPIPNLAGGVLYDHSGSLVEFRIFPVVFREEMCRGMDYRTIERELYRLGLLIKQISGQYVKVVNFNGASAKMYVISGAILES